MRRPRRTIPLLCAAFLMVTWPLSSATGARATVPNAWGFAYVDVAMGAPSPAYQAGSWTSGAVASLPGATGQVEVRFPQIGVSGGVVHVTAVSPNPDWCQVQSWKPLGSDLSVQVQCYKFGGAPAFVPFTVAFEQSSGIVPAPHKFAYVHYDGKSMVSSYNSAGAANNVSAGPTGVWKVTLPGLGTSTLAGGLQVTAVDPAKAARCKVGDWMETGSAQLVEVRCYDATTTPVGTGWTLTYQYERAVTGKALPPKLYAYAMDVTPGKPGPYTPSPAGLTFNSTFVANTFQDFGSYRWASFPGVGSQPDHVQVTAFGPGPEYCKLGGLWTTAGGNALVQRVACFDALTPVKRQTLVTYTSVH